jgi:hypothetical protein
MCKLYVSITPFYIRDLNIHRFWYPQSSGIIPPQRQREYIVLNNQGWVEGGAKKTGYL